MTIDWSKAPEGATHWAPATNRFGSSFMKLEDGHWFCQKANGTGWTIDDSDDCPSRYISRPLAWSDEGLPPVGTVCEWRDDDAGCWHKVEVRYLSKHTALLHFPGDGEGDTEGAFSPSTCQFRPIRTPEQIAAEERKKAIDEMVYGGCGAARDGSNTTAFILCALLYDAGYRKTEGGAA